MTPGKGVRTHLKSNEIKKDWVCGSSGTASPREREDLSSIPSTGKESYIECSLVPATKCQVRTGLPVTFHQQRHRRHGNKLELSGLKKKNLPRKGNITLGSSSFIHFLSDVKSPLVLSNFSSLSPLWRSWESPLASHLCHLALRFSSSTSARATL
jgi:hypothetical protein